MRKKKKNVWKGRIGYIPVSAITANAAMPGVGTGGTAQDGSGGGGGAGGGVERVKDWIAQVMDSMSY